MTKFKGLFLSFILILSFSLARVVFADTGPKPSMEFQFKFDPGVEESTIVSGILYECSLPDCTDAVPLEEVGPQGLYCELDSCRALGYGFAPFHILLIEFSDGVIRRSNTFETAGFDSYYTVTVRPDDLMVEARLSLGTSLRASWYFIACACMLMGAGLVIGLIVFFVRRSAKN